MNNRSPAAILATFALLLLSHLSRGQSYERVFSFTDAHAQNKLGTINKGSPSGDLCEDVDGYFYGTTGTGGTAGKGTVYRMSSTGTLTTLLEFNGTSSPKGASPRGVIAAPDGYLYGTTSTGGANNLGTVYKITRGGTLTTLADFTGNGTTNKGSNPDFALTLGPNGNLYGVTSYGGTAGWGTVFMITPSGTLTTLVNFTRTTGVAKGALPNGSLTLGKDGNLYGVTEYGGTADNGTIFKVTPGGVFTTLYEFSSDGAKGALPFGRLLQAADGTFYGTTFGGGPGFSNDPFLNVSNGTVFKMTPAGVLTTLVFFNGSSGPVLGRQPATSLSFGSDGNIYGSTTGGGTNDAGTYFKMTLGGGFTTISPTLALGTLVLGSDGFFYAGSVKVTPDGTVTQLVTFSDTGNPGNGFQPQGSVIEGSDGNLYGTTSGQTGRGETGDLGTVFRLTPSGDLTFLAKFGVDTTGHGDPHAGLVRGADGNFYGTTYYGGTADNGTVFKITAGGQLTTLVSFIGTGGNPAGSNPSTSLIQGSDGNFYGTTEAGGLAGGLSGLGTVFRMTPSGTLTTLVQFTDNGASNKGKTPQGALVQASDQNYYGTTYAGGANGLGTIFKMTSGGALTTLVEFTGNGASNKGSNPEAGLVQGSDGSLYGTTFAGGANGLGTVFKVTTAGTLTTLVEFTGNGTSNKGSKPQAALLLARDGNFYGTTSTGGANDLGTVFKMTPAGVLSTVYEFSSPDAKPMAPLSQAADGTIYGTTFGPFDGGIFRLIFAGAPLLYATEVDVQGPTTAVVRATLNAAGSATTLSAEYGTDGVNFTSVPVTSVGGSFQSTLLGTTLASLVENTIYYYRFRAVSTAGTTVSPVQTFSTLAKPHVVSTSPTAITRTRAQLNGTVNARGYATAVTIQWDTDGQTFGNSVPIDQGTITGITDTNVSATLTTLQSGTTYFYRIVATSAGGTSVSGTQSFITLTDPVATVGGASVLSANSALVTGTVDAKGASTMAVFEYATNAQFTGSLSTSAVPAPVVGVGATSVTATLSGLTPGATYYYRVVATSAGGSGTSSANTFNTPSLPLITATNTDSIGVASARLNGTANANGLTTTVEFEFGTDGVTFPNRLSATPGTVTGSTATAVSASVGGLTGATTYYFRVRGTSSAGSVVSATVVPFTTLIAPSASTSAVSGVSASSAVAAGSVNAHGSSTDVVVEYGTDGVNFPFAVTATPSPVASTGDTTVTAVLSGLSQNTTYFYRVRATSAAGTAVGNAVSFTTAQLPLVAIGSATGVSIAGATLSATVNARGNDTTVTMEVSTDISFATPNILPATPSPVSGSSPTLVTATLGSLPAATTHYYRLRAVSTAGVVVSDPAAFTTPSPPVPIATGATNTTGRSAVLNGTVDAVGASATVSFQLVADDQFTNPSTVVAVPSPISGSGPVAVTAVVNGLQPGATYYFRLNASSGGGARTSASVSFATLALPTVSGLSESEVGSQTARLNATVNGNGQATTVVFEYGPAADSLPFVVGSSPATINGSTDTAVSAAISGLQAVTRIFYRVRATSVAGETVVGPANFKTNPSALAVTNPGSATLSSASLSGRFNAYGQQTTVDFVYGTNSSQLDQSIAAGNGTLNGTADMTLGATVFGLTPGTHYFFRARATNGNGSTLADNIEEFDVPGNDAPVAVPDLIFYSRAVTFNPLINDTDANNKPPIPANADLHVKEIVRQPQVAKGVAKVLVDADPSKQVLIGYVPQFNVLDDDSLTYRVQDPQGATADGVVRLVTYAKRAGAYGATLGSDGVISLEFDGTGSVTLSNLMWKGAIYRVKGVFDSGGQLLVPLTLPAGTLEILLKIDPDAARLTGSVTEKDGSGAIVQTIPTELKANAGAGGLASSGLRTALLEAPPELKEQMGNGYLLLQVAKNGKTARIAGQLPDGERFSAGVPAAGTKFPLLTNLKAKGALAGTVRVVQMGDTGAGMMGTLAWNRSAISRARVPGASGPVALEMHGSEYPVLPKLSLPPIALGSGVPNAHLQFTGGGSLTAPLNIDVTITPTGVSGFDPSSLKLKLRPDLGTFAGQFRDPRTGKFIPFDGAFRASIDGDGGQAAGVFTGPLTPGAVWLKSGSTAEEAAAGQ